MTFSQRYYRSPRTHLGLLLDRLRQEQHADPQHASSFQDICDMVSIPRDLRRTLLRTLLGAGYATDLGQGRIRLSELGRRVAARDTDEPTLPDDQRLFRATPPTPAPPRPALARPGGLRPR